MRTLILALLLLPGMALAQSVNLTEQGQPYEVVPVEAAAGVATSFLGELTGFPIMYEVRSETPFTLNASVRQLGNKQPQPFTLIAIRQNDRGGGVTEVGRMRVDPTDWERSRDGQIGLSFITSPAVEEEVEAGVYRIEVSTSENAGKYELLIDGAVGSQSYFERLSDVRLTQQFFGYSILAMLSSRLVHMPLLVIVLSYISFLAWRRYQSVPVRTHD